VVVELVDGLAGVFAGAELDVCVAGALANPVLDDAAAVELAYGGEHVVDFVVGHAFVQVADVQAAAGAVGVGLGGWSHFLLAAFGQAALVWLALLTAVAVGIAPQVGAHQLGLSVSQVASGIRHGQTS